MSYGIHVFVRYRICQMNNTPAIAQPHGVTEKKIVPSSAVRVSEWLGNLVTRTFCLHRICFAKNELNSYFTVWGEFDVIFFIVLIFSWQWYWPLYRYFVCITHRATIQFREIIVCIFTLQSSSVKKRHIFWRNSVMYECVFESCLLLQCTQDYNILI